LRIPVLEATKAAVWFYHGRIASHVAKAGDLVGIPADTSEKLTMHLRRLRLSALSGQGGYSAMRLH
jgi:hypothetical protein